MKSKAQAIFGQRLVQFLLVGGALFAASTQLTAPEPGDLLREPIVVSRDRIDALRKDWARRTGRDPTAVQVRNSVDQAIDDEVLYRHAISLGLDRTDLIVRRRLIQKMRFLMEDLTPPRVPTRWELQEILEASSASFTIPAAARVSQVFAATRKRAEALAEKIRRRHLGPREAAVLADPTLLELHLPFRTEDELKRAFGPTLARKTLRLDPGSWSEPIQSPYGFHLVWVHARRAASSPSLEDSAVRGEVERRWQKKHRKVSNRKMLDNMRREFSIEVEETLGEPLLVLRGPAS